MIEYDQKCEICGYLIPRLQDAAKAQGLSGLAASEEAGCDMSPPQDRLCTGCCRAVRAAREQRAKGSRRLK